jgi:hypothetical protein
MGGAGAFEDSTGGPTVRRGLCSYSISLERVIGTGERALERASRRRLSKNVERVDRSFQTDARRSRTS